MSAERLRRQKVNCPACLHWDSKVTGGHYDDATHSYVRHRKCQACGQSFQSDETLRVNARFILAPQDTASE